MFFILVYVTFIFIEQQVHVWAEGCHLSQTSKSVLIIHSLPYAEFGFCNHEITQTNTGNYTWEETEGNNVVLQGCALGPAQGIAVEDAVARRKCNMFGEWENPDTDNCITIVSRQFMDLQESITTVSILFLLLVLQVLQFLQNHRCHPTIIIVPICIHMRGLRGTPLVLYNRTASNWTWSLHSISVMLVLTSSWNILPWDV